MRTTGLTRGKVANQTEECRTPQTTGHTLGHCPSDLAICKAASELGSSGRSLQDRGSDSSAGVENESKRELYSLYVTARKLISSKPHRLVCEVLRLAAVELTTIESVWSCRSVRRS